MQWSFLHYLKSKNILVFQHQCAPITFAEFWHVVASKTQFLMEQPQHQYALWTEDSYVFLTWFWASILAKKTLILPPHRIAQLEQDFLVQGIHFLDVELSIGDRTLDILDVVQDWDTIIATSEIIFFTSGSTGEAKKIPRTLAQLLLEVVTLQRSFDFVASYTMLASVSHQHIYGVLYKLLLPLMSGQSFFREQLAYPEQIVAAQQQLLNQSHYLVSSPALLKRCIGSFDFSDAEFIFSSGGKLDEGIRTFYTQPIIEILGSSETGGIAIRKQDHATWLQLCDVEISIDEQQNLWVKTAHAYCDDWIATGDLAQVNQEGFLLLGRSDRLVKLEEKRLSLDAIERIVTQLESVQQCHVLLTTHAQRELLSIVIVLSETSQMQLIEQGKQSIVAQIKRELKGSLESIAMPRLWRFVRDIPVNQQSKIDKNKMRELFSDMKYPLILSQQIESEQAEYQLEFPPELICFKGHFNHFPVYPGVGQIGFLVKFSQQLWINLDFCTGYEQLKFQDLIRPYDVLTLSLKRQAHKVIFELHHQTGRKIASGRLLFQLVETS